MNTLRVLALLTSILAAGCGKKEEIPPPVLPPVVAPELRQTEIANIAEAIAKDMGRVRSTQTKGIGVPVLVFEEAHNAVVGQLEQAVMLARAYNQFGLKQVVLEGYYEGALEEGARKVQQLVSKRRSSALEDVGASLVGEGEIRATLNKPLISGTASAG